MRISPLAARPTTVKTGRARRRSSGRPKSSASSIRHNKPGSIKRARTTLESEASRSSEFGAQLIEPYFPPAILYMSLINLLAGNALLIYLTMVAPFRRRWTYLAPWGVTVVGYWVLMTIASYKALKQLVSNPFYWEKTQHGLSKHTANEVAEASAEATEAAQ